MAGVPLGAHDFTCTASNGPEKWNIGIKPRPDTATRAGVLALAAASRSLDVAGAVAAADTLLRAEGAIW